MGEGGKREKGGGGTRERTARKQNGGKIMGMAVAEVVTSASVREQTGRQAAWPSAGRGR